MTHQQLLPGESGIDRDHAVTPLEQIFEGEIARPAGIGGNPDHRDRLHGVEDAADIAIVVVVVVHAGRLFALNIRSPRRARKSARYAEARGTPASARGAAGDAARSRAFSVSSAA